MPREPVNKPQPPPQEPKLDPKTPVLAIIKTSEMELDVDHWFKKQYSLDFGLAATELPCFLEEINDHIQRFSIWASDAKRDYEWLEGQKRMKLRQDWSTTYTDKMTETTVESVLAQDQELYDEWHRFTVLKSYVDRLRETMENLRLKLQAMRSSEATRRKTIDDEPR